MSTRQAQVSYLPEGGTSAVDLDYAQSFIELATAIEACQRSEDVALLLSTCRNHWMTTNSAFLDLRRALGAGDYPDSMSAALFQLGQGRGAEAKAELAKAGEYLAHARQKLKVWDEREPLLAQVELAASQMEGLAPARFRRMLAEQRRTVAGVEDTDHIRYLVLSEREEAVCSEKCRVLRQVADRLTAVRDVIREISSLRGEAQGSLLEPERDLAETPEGLLAPLLADPNGWALEIEEMEARFGATKSETFDFAGANSEEEWLAFLGHLTETARLQLSSIQELLAGSFRANVARPSMPEPYIIDLTVDPYRGGDEEYEVQLHGAKSVTPANEATVALLKWPIPDSAYNNTVLCRFEDQLRVEVGQVVFSAIRQAAECGAAFVILPELSLPSESADEVDHLSRELGIGVIGGREHRAEESGLIVNEALIHVPELPRRIEQLKQRPSVDEPLDERFLVKRQLNVIRGTALGTLLVVVCSDYLEHDIVSRARADEHIDTIIVCSRNGNPDVFARLAMADAVREYCNVIVVNSYQPPGAPPSASGTIIAVPRRDDPMVETNDVPLIADGALAEGAELALATINMKAIYSRSHGRSDHGYLRPSRFASRR